MELLSFLKRWNGDNSSMSQFLGTAMANAPTFLDQFNIAFGQAVFAKHLIPQRIDFFYKPSLHKQQDAKIFKKSFKVGITDGVPWIQDVEGIFGGLNIMLLRNTDPDVPNSYSIRVFVTSSPCLGPSHLPTFKKVSGIKSRNQKSHQTYSNVGVNDDCFWNFFVDDGKIHVCDHSEGFLDTVITRRIAFVIERTTNLLGFSV